MLLKELKRLLINESGMRDEDLIRSILFNVEKDLPDDARYKSFDVLASSKTVIWITQQSSERQSKEAANIIASKLANAGFRGWTVKVVLRDLYRGEDDETPWQVSHTDDVQSDGSESDANDMSKHFTEFEPLHRENDLDDYDATGRNTRHIRKYSIDIGPVTYVQINGVIRAVWYDRAGIGSVPVIGNYTDIDEYIDADPFNPSNPNNLHV